MSADKINLVEEIISRIKPIIATWKDDDIYAISLFVNDYNDNPCQPTFTLGYNTECQYKKAISRASSPLEAKWNYAFWLQNDKLVFGINETAEIVKQWILSKQLPFFTYEEMFETDECNGVDDEQLYRITQEFVDVLVDVVKELHGSGFMKSNFKNEIPVIIHELEYYEEIAKQNIKANTRQLLKDFIDFINE